MAKNAKREIIDVVEGYWTPGKDWVKSISKFGYEFWNISDIFKEKINDNKVKVRITIEKACVAERPSG